MDDEELVCEMAKEMLTRSGHEVLLAKDGAEAVQVYNKYLNTDEMIDIIIMDLTIPGGMGGENAVQEILKLDPDAKVIVSSGYSTDPIVANYQNYGFCASISKPFRQADLLSTLSEVLMS